MNMPRFTAEASLRKSGSDCRLAAHSADSYAGTVIPAIPFCGNCDYILENCERNGYRPRALCAACLSGNCLAE
jgi:hypothetical protein